MIRLFIITAVTGLLMVTPAAAQMELEFETAEQKAIYTVLTEELRCLVCANQTLADSKAPLAKDLRGNIYEMVSAGQSREEIIDYMVSRYGQYVLYRPRMSADTLFLWFGPFLAALAAFVFVIVVIKLKARQKPDIYPDEQLQKVKSLLKNYSQS